MNKRSQWLLIGQFIPVLVFGQNHVPNHSFEDHTSCPDDYGQVERCIGWSRSLNNNLPAYHTEYLHACGSFTFGAPMNTWGEQEPITGDGYMALVTLAPSVMIDYRENIYTELIAPLEVGKTYTIQINASLTDNSRFASNNLGAKLSTTTDFPINNSCQLAWPDVILNTQGWTTLSTTFVADSAYTHLAIGNFMTDANTTSITACVSCPFTLQGYYIDDVCLVNVAEQGSYDCSFPLNPLTVQLTGSPRLRLTPTLLGPGTSIVSIELPVPSDGWLELLDHQGRLIRTTPTNSATLQTVQTTDLANGTYIVSMVYRTGGRLQGRITVLR